MANNYNDALERAKQAIIDCGSNASRKEMIYGIFPELRENEEERIKDTLHSIICRAINDQGTPYEEREFISKKVLPYVEKLQGQKLDENITAEEMKQAMDDVLNFKIAVTDMAKTFNIKIDHNRDIDWHNFCASLLTYLKRHAEWSEKDEGMLGRVVDTIGDSILECDCDNTGIKAKFALEEERKWLKSLPERFNPQPKQELSDEEKDKLNRIYLLIRSATAKENHPLIGDNEANELQGFLSNLSEKFK